MVEGKGNFTTTNQSSIPKFKDPTKKIWNASLSYGEIALKNPKP